MLEQTCVLADPTDDIKRRMTQQWFRLTQELDDIEARIVELEMLMARYGIDSLACMPQPTRH